MVVVVSSGTNTGEGGCQDHGTGAVARLWLHVASSTPNRRHCSHQHPTCCLPHPHPQPQSHRCWRRRGRWRCVRGPRRAHRSKRLKSGSLDKHSHFIESCCMQALILICGDRDLANAFACSMPQLARTHVTCHAPSFMRADCMLTVHPTPTSTPPPLQAQTGRLQGAAAAA